VVDPIPEQDTTQEISSITQPNINKQNGYYVTVNNDESQYLFTSAQASIELQNPYEHRKFEFNSNALADSDDEKQQKTQSNTKEYQDNQGFTSEPQLMSYQPSSKVDSDFKSQRAPKHSSYREMAPDGKHHHGGSFGKLEVEDKEEFI
jgi:hypothetical protein